MQQAVFGDLHGEAKSAIKDECPFWGTKRRGPSVRQIRTLSKIWLAIWNLHYSLNFDKNTLRTTEIMWVM